MAITNYLVHFKTSATFNANKSQLKNDAVAFVGDATIIHTHGTDYYCGSGPVALKSDLSGYATTSALTSGLAGKANTSHTHTISQVSGLQTELDSKLESADLSGYALKTDLRTPLVLDVGEGLESSGTLTGIEYDELISAINDGRQVLVKSNDNLISPTGIVNSGSACTITFDSYPQSFTLTISPNLEYVSTQTLIQTTLTQLGITATASELNQLDGVSLSNYALKSEIPTIPSLSGGASATSGQYVSGVTVNGHTVTVTKATLPTTTLSSLGVTATATELNYMDGVTSNVQTQLNGKAASSHTHTASQVSGLADVATSGSYNDLSDKPEIPDVSELATKSELSNYLPLTGGTLTGNLFFQKNSGIAVVEGTGMNIRSTNNGADPLILSGGGTFLQLNSSSDFVVGDSQILTEGNWSDYVSFTDTKNTTGTSNSTSRLYLAGGTSQSSTGVQTYSNNAVYTQSGQLYATQMNSTNGFYETSDARLKDFKEDIKALDTIDQIPTKYFTWKKDENQESQIGTSAQEIEKIYPELVSKTEDDTLTVDYAKLSIIALAAIKELKAEIQSLKEEVKQLKSK